jgi:hypothetical protein
MIGCKRALALLASISLLVPLALAQSGSIPQATEAREDPATHNVRLTVVVTRNSGEAVSDLRADEFRLLDEKQERQITYLHGVAVGDRGFRYELDFGVPSAKIAGEYHHVEVQIARPNLTVTTQKGYAAQIY